MAIILDGECVKPVVVDGMVVFCGRGRVKAYAHVNPGHKVRTYDIFTEEFSEAFPETLDLSVSSYEGALKKLNRNKSIEFKDFLDLTEITSS